MILDFDLDLPCKTSPTYLMFEVLLVVGSKSIKMPLEDKYQRWIYKERNMIITSEMAEVLNF